jgi:hypothetical protein
MMLNIKLYPTSVPLTKKVCDSLSFIVLKLRRNKSLKHSSSPGKSYIQSHTSRNLPVNFQLYLIGWLNIAGESAYIFADLETSYSFCGFFYSKRKQFYCNYDKIVKG